MSEAIAETPDIAANLAQVRERISAAAVRAGRNPQAVRLVAVSKTKPADAVRQALAAGQVLFGENRVQEALEKIDEIGSGPQWHLIGHLQSNKARFVPGRFAMVESVDSARLAQQLDRHAAAADLILNILLQLNWQGESSKAGVLDESELQALLEAVLACGNLRVCGLMTIPDPALDEQGTRGVYAEMRNQLERLASSLKPGPQFRELSMGMSHDYELAIEEGATLVRVGTAIFGARP